MYSGRNNIYEATIRRMVRQSVEAKNQRFLQEHQGDPDEALLEYLREGAQRLGHPPHIREIIGGEYICERMGSWETALSRAGLAMPYTPDKLSQFAVFAEEEKAQREIYRSRRAERIKRKRQNEEKTEETL